MSSKAYGDNSSLNLEHIIRNEEKENRRNKWEKHYFGEVEREYTDYVIRTSNYSDKHTSDEIYTEHGITMVIKYGADGKVKKVDYF